MPYKLYYFAAVLLVIFTGCGVLSTESEQIPVQIVAIRPHDLDAYTQGLQLVDGRLFESTGLYGESSVREVDPLTGRVLRKTMLDSRFFGEGLTMHAGELWVLTWMENTALVMNPDTFDIVRSYSYDGEGWGLTSDGKHLIMSDGTSTLKFIEPTDFSVVKKLRVTESGVPLMNLNELEFINGSIFANVYLTDRIVRINPRSGRVTGYMQLNELRRHLAQPNRAEVLNGIAYDEQTGHLLVTGKYWPMLFVLQWK
ncbi:MAG TPA: glutaminyl-peptide cyclotransferase [Kiritimatiellia bacterium]|nr:glutaminyl-peptide cyclotransferase [Kiritimatiellia bacterium]